MAWSFMQKEPAQILTSALTREPEERLANPTTHVYHCCTFAQLAPGEVMHMVLLAAESSHGHMKQLLFRSRYHLVDLGIRYPHPATFHCWMLARWWRTPIHLRLRHLLVHPIKQGQFCAHGLLESGLACIVAVPYFRIRQGANKVVAGAVGEAASRQDQQVIMKHWWLITRVVDQFRTKMRKLLREAHFSNMLARSAELPTSASDTWLFAKWPSLISWKT